MSFTTHTQSSFNVEISLTARTLCSCQGSRAASLTTFYH